jgi:hypothetical protein
LLRLLNDKNTSVVFVEKNLFNKLSNCVCLCVNLKNTKNCHLIAHGGDFYGDYVIKKADYDYWNGKLKTQKSY